MNVTATELKHRLGRYLEAAQVEPVVVEKSGRVTSVVLSKRRYDQLCELEDRFWDLQAQTAEQEGFMSDSEVRELLQTRHEPDSQDIPPDRAIRQNTAAQTIQTSGQHDILVIEQSETPRQPGIKGQPTG